MTIFFLVTTLSLFLGDGLQAPIDVVWAGVILALFLTYIFKNNNQVRPLSTTLYAFWGLILVYCIIRTFFSDSAAYSITSTVRFIEAYLLFVLFYSIASEKTARMFSFGIIVVATFSLIISFFLILFPLWAQTIPLMNLLYATFGHNHLADMLVLATPLVAASNAPLKYRTKTFLLILFLAGLVLTFARGAWALITGYIIFVVLTQKPDKTIKIIFTIVFGIICGLFIATSLLFRFNQAFPQSYSNNWLYRQFIKPSVIDARQNYWTQSLQAIIERPLFGSGPGTFYLQSKRLEQGPNEWSWFAHSLPLQLLVELGVIGATPFFLLLFFVGRTLIHIIKNKNSNSQLQSPLAQGLCLTLLYSCVEFNLNFLVIWVLFWGGVGVLMGMQKPNAIQSQKLLPTTLLIILGLYYVSFMGSYFVLSMGHNTMYAFFLAPYSVNRALDVLDKDKRNADIVSRQQIALVTFFHQQDPEVLFALGGVRSDQDNTASSTDYYRKAKDLDPFNETYQKQYFQTLVFGGQTNLLGPYVRNWNALMVKQNNKNLESIDFSSSLLLGAYKDIFMKRAFSVPKTREEISRVDYFLGLSFIKSNPKMTRQFWVLSRDVAPEWSYYHVELASLETYVFNNESEAIHILTECQQYKYPAEDCRGYLRNIRELPTPGSLEEEVLNIPHM